MLRQRLSILIMCALPCFSSAADMAEKCAEVNTAVVNELEPLILEKLGKLEPVLRNKAKVKGALICGSRILARFYVPPHSANEVDLPFLSWDLSTGKTRIGFGG